MKSLAIFGDSFGAVKPDHEFQGWVELLQDHYNVKNFCQCGSSQYRIYQQIKSVDLSQFDKILITHTSPFRVYVRDNPTYSNDPVYKNCDLIFADVNNRDDEFSVSAKNYFKYIFDERYSLDIHNLICKDIENITRSLDCLHITHFDYSQCYQFSNFISFYDLWIHHRGPVHHYDRPGNREVFSKVFSRL